MTDDSRLAQRPRSRRSPADILPGDWSLLAEAAKMRWPRLMDAEIAGVEGRRDVLEEIVRRRYGMSENQAAHDVGLWIAGVQNPD